MSIRKQLEKNIGRIDQFDDTPEGQQKRWIAELTASKNKLQSWHTKGDEVYNRYLDKRGAGEESGRFFNLFNTNTGILQSALYARIPTPDVSRRFKDSRDQVGRVASLVLQRCLTYELETDNYFDTTTKNIILDRLVPGAGVGWVRYSTEKQDAQLSDDQDELTEGTEPTIVDEQTPIDYVNWKDFAFSPARTWDEVRWVGRRVFLNYDELTDRFGEEKANEIPFEIEAESNKTDDPRDKLNEQAEIWEIWDKTSKKVYFVNLGCTAVLDVKDDFLGLRGFFPTAKPLFANCGTSDLIPKSDYEMVKDQYEELDQINNRISNITKAIRVVGVYDAKNSGLKSLLSDAADNEMVPVENWGSFSEQGGMTGAVDFMPLETAVASLGNLQKAREVIKGQIYELTGISDVVRGQAQQYVTAQAEAMKGQYASLRLSTLQKEVAEYLSVLIEHKAHLICKFYEPERILERCGQLQDVDHQYLPQAIALLKNEQLRHMRVRVSVDALQMPDWNADKQAKTELTMAMSQFMSQVIPAAKNTPEIAPLALEMMRFAVSGHKAAEPIAGVIEDGLRELQMAQQKAAANPQPKPPSPEEIKLQMEQAKIQADNQIAQMKMAADQERAKDQLALDQSRAATQVQIEQMKIEADKEIALRKLALDEAKLALEQQRLRLDEMNMVVNAKLKAKSNLPAANDMMAGDLGDVSVLDDLNNVLPTDHLSDHMRGFIEEEANKHMSKQDFLEAMAANQAQMQQMTATFANAINTLVNTPLPPQTIKIHKTDNGLSGTIE